MKKAILSLILSIFLYTISDAQPSVVAAGFNSISGIEMDADEKIWITETGSGNDDGKVSIINTDGSVEVFMEGLPSFFNADNGETQGTWRTYQLPENKIIVVMGEGEDDLSGTLLTVDKMDYTPGNPLGLADVEATFNVSEFSLGQGFLESNPYTLTWDSEGHMYIVDAAANALLKRDKDTDELSVFAEFPSETNPLPFGPPMIDAVPTKVLAKPGGGFYVSTLTGFPFVNGLAKIYEVDEQGVVSIFKDGFTLLTDLEIDPTDGNLCALQFAEFAEVDSMLTFVFNSAQVIKLYPDGSQEILADEFGPSPDFTFDDNGNVYATHLFLGQVLKFDLMTATREPRNIVSDITTFFPNPFKGATFIDFYLKEPADVSLEIINQQGKRIKTVTDKVLAGQQVLCWDGLISNGQKAPSGLYAYKLNIAGKQQTGWVYLTE